MKVRQILKWSTIGLLAIATPLAALQLAVSPALAAGDGSITQIAANLLGLTGPRWGEKVDYQVLLAEALGISVEELQSAVHEADLAAIQQLVDQGTITEDQAGLMQARLELRAYLDQGSLVAEALGISTAELQQARADGKTIADLIDEQGLDQATFQENLSAARQSAIDQAVADGVITQEQADQLLAAPHHELQDGGRPGRGPGRGGRFGGRQFSPPPGGPGSSDA